jgi:hypothetical protein
MLQAETKHMEFDPAPIFIAVLALLLFFVLRTCEAGYRVISSKLDERRLGAGADTLPQR